MDLRSDNPYWLLRNGILHSYPSLAEDMATDIAIIGGGISGALTAWYLCESGYRVVLVDRRHIGMGSTAASTALLQYEIDTPLHQLMDKVGEGHAVKSYLLCRDAIDELGRLCRQVQCGNSFTHRPSFQFASFKKSVAPLRKEYVLRRRYGISLEWLDEKQIQQGFGFNKPAGLLSADGAEVDAYHLTHQLLQASIDKGLQVYDHTCVTHIDHQKKLLYCKQKTAAVSRPENWLLHAVMNHSVTCLFVCSNCIPLM